MNDDVTGSFPTVQSVEVICPNSISFLSSIQSGKSI